VQFVQQFPVSRKQSNLQRHLSVRVGGATEAGVKGADDRFDVVQHSFVELLAPHKMARDLKDPAIHRQIVVPGRDDQVSPGDKALFIHTIVMNERAPRCFTTANPFKIIERRGIPGVGLGDDGIK